MIELPHRLTPEMTSRQHQVLGFIKRYYLEHGCSPTLGEIAGHLRVSRKNAHGIVGRLENKGQVLRARGQRRGIMLADPAKHVSEIDALLRLQSEGWHIVAGTRALADRVTTLGLPLAPQLDHIPDVAIGDGRDDRKQRRRRGAV